MGTFHTRFKISGVSDGQRWEELSFLVDTGSTLTALPRDALKRLAVKPEFTDSFELADGRVVKRKVGHIRLRYRSKNVITPVVFSPPETEPLVGAIALEALALTVDPVRPKLKPTRFLMKVAE